MPDLENTVLLHVGPDPGNAGLPYFVGPGKLAPPFFFNETVLVEVLHVDNEIPAVIARGWDDQSVDLAPAYAHIQ